MRADYVRVFPWRTFTFIDEYGKDRSNPEWRKLCKVSRVGPRPVEMADGKQ